MDPISQHEAIDVLERGHATLSALFARLDDEQAQQPKTIGGGDWSAKDLMGHIAFWEELAIEAIESWRAGRRPQAEDIFGSEDVDAANARNHERTTVQTLGEVRERFARAHATLVALIRGTSDEEWLSKPSYPAQRRRALREMLAAVVGAPKGPFDHASAHEADLRDAVEAFRT
ncbi:MAG TPA: DinB family protein [Actinomycetota bacterium]